MKNIVLIFGLVSMAFITSCSGSKQVVQEAIPEVAEATEERMLEEIVVIPEEEEVYRASEKRIVDLKHTQLDVRFDWEKRHLIGNAVLDLKPHFYPISSVTLDAKGFDIDNVALLKNGAKSGLKYNYDGKELVIELDRTYTREEVIQLEIDYVAKPDELEAGGSAAITSDKGLYFINPDGTDKEKPQQIWTQGETEASSCWFPTIDAPNERTTQEIYITVQDRFKTLSNGRLVSSNKNADGTRTDYWKQEINHAPYLFAMAIGEFAVVTDTWNGKTVDYYVEPAYEQYARQIFGNTPEMMDFFSNKLNYPFPWDKYSQVVVREFVSGAMENSSAVIFMDALQKTDRELLDETHEDIIAHELFHHWFGDIVTCESWANLPLNESFATYGEYLWEEQKYGKDAADKKLQGDVRTYLADAARNGKSNLIRFNYEDKEDMFDGHSYAKGGTILHMLRNYVGDEAFYTSLNKYLVDNEYQPVEIHQLRIAFEHVVGEDLNWFFNQWFMGAGHPIFNIDYNYNEAEDKTYVTIEQTQEEDVFDLPIAIDVYRNGEMTREKVFIEERVFEWATNGNPDWINVDGDKVVTCEKTDNKTTEQYIKQYEQGKLYLDRYEAIEYLGGQSNDSAARDVVESALSDDFWAIRELAASEINFAMGEKAPKIEKLKDLALNDKKSAVRAMALDKLAESGDKTLGDFYSKGLDDRSYAVMGSAMSALVEVDEPKAYAEAKKLASSDIGQVAQAVSSVYAVAGSESDIPFFENAFNKFGLNTKFGMVTDYGDLLSRVSSNSKVENGLKLLHNMAINDDVKWMRFNAMRAMSNVKASLGAKQEEATEQAEKDQFGNVIATITDYMEEAKSKETDKDIQGLFARFGY